MPRKSAAMLKSQQPTDPIELAEWRFRSVERELEEAWAENDKMFSEKTGDGLRKGVDMEDFEKSLARISQLQRTAFNTFDAWQHAIKHKDDVVPVPEEEVRAILAASLSDKLSDLNFKVNYGILASKVAQAIRRDVYEEELDVPYCEDHR